MDFDIVEDGIEYYKTAVGEGITPFMFVQCGGMFLVFLIIRFLLLLSMENVSFKCKSDDEKVKKYFLLSHVTIEGLIGFVIAYTIIVLRNSQPYNYIWNMLIAPGAGMILAILIDLKVVMPKEADAPLSLSIYKAIKKGSEPKDDSSAKPMIAGQNNNSLAPRINIQVNTGNGNMETNSDNNDKKDIQIVDKTIEGLNVTEQINTKDTTRQEETMSEIKISESNDEIIRSLIDMQEQQAIAMKNMSEIIEAMRENIVTNMRFELHDAMMECITRGSATPKEYERVTEKFHNYKNLGGNHGISNLYDEKFKLLPIR